jgi:pimeloyl-ACP methyl ester carboxylesterase
MALSNASLELTDDKYPRIDLGSGMPILLLHGMFGKPDNWDHALEHLSEKHRAITLELPIFDSSWRDPTVEGLSRYVVDFMEWAELDGAVMVGNSLGGHIALYLACFYSELTRGLVLTGSSGLFERGYEQGIPTSPNRDWIYDRVAEIFYDKSSIRPVIVDEVAEFLKSRRNKFRLVKVAKSAKRTHMGEHLSKIEVPTLLVWGREDTITPLDVAHEFRDNIADHELVIYEECGHAPMLEYPEKFTESLLDFLDRRIG